MHRQAYATEFRETLPIEWPTTGWTRCEIRRVGEALPRIKQLEVAMKDLGYPRKDSYAVAVALREAIANAVIHGNRGDTSRTVMLNYHLTPEEVLLEVADEGLGFDPSAVPSPLLEEKGGRGKLRWGLLLMRIYMTWIRFNERGNRAVFCKWRSSK